MFYMCSGKGSGPDIDRVIGYPAWSVPGFLQPLQTNVESVPPIAHVTASFLILSNSSAMLLLH